MNRPTEIVIARHGEAVCNVAGVVGGEHGCKGLTTAGRQQARQLAGRLAAEHATWPYEAFYATPRRRVHETAQIVSDALGVPAVVEHGLRGPDHGEGDGRPWTEIKTTFGGPPQHDPDRPYASGSETWNGYLTRAVTTIATILGRHDGQRVLIVAHGEAVEAAHTLLLNLPANTCLRFGFVTDHTGITRWQRQTNRFGRTIWLLAAHNDTRHLRDEPA